MSRFYQRLCHYSSDKPVRTALVTGSSHYNYQELLEEVDALDSRLSHIPSGAVVALLGGYSFKSIALLLWLEKRACIIAPIATQNPVEREQRLAELGPQYILDAQTSSVQCFAGNDQHKLVQRLQDRGAAGLVLFSSGSTGKPKVMLHDFTRLLDGYLQQKPRKMSVMVLLMFDHIGGLNTLFNSLASGMKICIPDSRHPEQVAAMIEQETVNILPASPTFLSLLSLSGACEKFNMHSLKLITYGSESMPASLLLRLKEHFTQARFLQTFGTSETGIIKTESRSSDSLDIRFVDKQQSYRVVNGELWLRSDYRIEGYLNHDIGDSSRNSEDGNWFRTGDLVEEHFDGYLRIKGRLNDVINVGGEKVFPAEVESCILELKGVDACSVYGAKNAITGNTVVANVTLSPGVNRDELKRQIKKHCQQHLDRFKIPSKLHFTDMSPMSERLKTVRPHNSLRVG